MNDVKLNPDSLSPDQPASSTQRLEPDEVPYGEPLKFDIVDPAGVRLLKAGTVLPSLEARAFLLAHFKPCRLVSIELPQASAQAVPLEAAPSAAAHITLAEMNIKTGATLRIRMPAQTGYGVLNSQVIGFAPNQALFVTPPHAAHQIEPVSLLFGERIDVLYMNRRSVFDFVCTVDAVCKRPFDFLVLSAPSNIRRLRARQNTRMRTLQPILYRHDADTGANSPFMGLGLLRDLSAGGFSMVASTPIAAEREQIRVAFQIVALGIAIDIDTVAVIRNVRQKTERSPWVIHGLEFVDLDLTTHMALRCLAID